MNYDPTTKDQTRICHYNHMLHPHGIEELRMQFHRGCIIRVGSPSYHKDFFHTEDIWHDTLDYIRVRRFYTT